MEKILTSALFKNNLTNTDKKPKRVEEFKELEVTKFDMTEKVRSKSLLNGSSSLPFKP